MAGKNARDYAKDYTRPELRARLKEEIKHSSRGGRPGQWSARKSQLLSYEYQKQGGGFRRGKRGPQRSLDRWTRQEWTSERGPRARHREHMHRYLPGKVWRMLSAEERREAERTKRRADESGRQIARWPPGVRRAMVAVGAAQGDPMRLRRDELLTFARRLKIRGISGLKKADLVKALQDR